MLKCQHLLNVGILTFISRIKTTSESSKARNIILQHFSFDDQGPELQCLLKVKEDLS